MPANTVATGPLFARQIVGAEVARGVADSQVLFDILWHERIAERWVLRLGFGGELDYRRGAPKVRR